ncbi:hypothetical protein [Pedobacter aquatilis]|uniref:hypothetical protein n=1 Tax=Pedobacter aquatilis TaxID=351343 RepID=UPI00292E42A4|nr:hypothetical protein [Pedobacter aquatilis]
MILMLAGLSLGTIAQTRPDTLKKKTEKKSKKKNWPEKTDTLKRDTMRRDTARRLPPGKFELVKSQYQ